MVSYQHTEHRELVEESTEDLKAERLTQTRTFMMGRTIANTMTSKELEPQRKKEGGTEGTFENITTKNFLKLIKYI